MPWLTAILFMVLAFGYWQKVEIQANQRQQVQQYMATMQLIIVPLMPIKDGELFKAQLNKLRAISLLQLESISIYNTKQQLLITTGVPSVLDDVVPVLRNDVDVSESHGYWLAQAPVVLRKSEPFLPSLSDETYMVLAVFEQDYAYDIWFIPFFVTLLAGSIFFMVVRSNIAQQQQRLQTDVGLIAHKINQIVIGQQNVSLYEDLVPEIAALKPCLNDLGHYQTELNKRYKIQFEQYQHQLTAERQQLGELQLKFSGLEKDFAGLTYQVQMYVQNISTLLAQQPEIDEKTFQLALAAQMTLIQMAVKSVPHKTYTVKLTDIVASILPQAKVWLSMRGVELSLFEAADNASHEVVCCAEHLGSMLMALVQLGARANAVSELTLTVKLCLTTRAPSLKLVVASNGDGISAQLCQRLNGEIQLPIQWHEADIGIIVSAVKQYEARIDVQLLDGLGSAVELEFPLIQVKPTQTKKMQHVLLFEYPQSSLGEHASSMSSLCEHVVKSSDINELQDKITQFTFDMAIIMLPEPAELVQWQHVLAKLNKICEVKCYSSHSHIAIWRETLDNIIEPGPFCLSDLSANNCSPAKAVPKLLVVDDNKTNLAFVQILMKEQQIELFIADCGVDAIKLCKQHRFNAILLDIQLPDIIGTDVAKQLRQLPSYQTTPILAFTAHALENEVEEYRKAGMDDVIFKPLETTKLGQILRWCSVGKDNNVGE